jgi:hypothetical protein
MSKFFTTIKLDSFKQKYFIKRKVILAPGMSRKSAMMLTSMLVISGMMYIWQVNDMATVGYEVRDLDVRVAELKKANQELSNTIAQSQSTARMMERLEELEMVPVGHVSYINASTSGVALNR